MKIETSDFASLIETWVLLEMESARLAALRRTDQEILHIREALDIYANKARLGEQAVEEALIFHLEIVEASKNAVLKSLILVIRPSVINNFLQLDIYKNKGTTTVLGEYEVLLASIIAKEPEKAAAAMQTHLKDFFDYGQRLKKR